MIKLRNKIRVAWKTFTNKELELNKPYCTPGDAAAKVLFFRCGDSIVHIQDDIIAVHDLDQYETMKFRECLDKISIDIN